MLGNVFCVYCPSRYGLRYHSRWPVFSDAVDQADLVRGVVVSATETQVVDAALLAYRFVSDSENGYLFAHNWEEAKQQFDRAFPEVAIENGAWGWIEDSATGTRVECGSIP